MFQVSVIKNNTEATTVPLNSTNDLIELLDSTQYPDGISPILFRNNHREGDNFLEASLTCLDFDGTLGNTEEEAERNIEQLFSGFNAIVKTSRNHLKAKTKGNKILPALPRYHVWLQLEDKVTTPEEYQATYLELIKQFPSADPSCKDVARQFYGSGKVIKKFKGKKVKIAQPVMVEKKEVDSLEVPSGMRGVLSAKTSDFLVRGPKTENWHNELISVVFDMRAQGYSKDEVEKSITKIAPYGYLDSHDLYHINDVFQKRSPKIEFRKEDKIAPHTLISVTDDFRERAKNIDQNVIKTGIESLDEKLILETGSGLGLIGAAASGKSALALEMLTNTSKNKVKSVFASLDMHRNRMYEKAMYRVNGISREELYKAFQEGREQKYVEKLKENFENVYFYSKSSPTVSDVRKYILDCQEEAGEKIKLVMLDYFERVSSDFSDDTQASKKVAGELQDMVNDLGVALVTIVQPNKMALSGGVDQPLYDYTKIKGSSYLYQSFRQIISIWRPGYNPKEFHNDRWLQMAILKNDLGELAEFAFKWDGRRGSITEMEDYEFEQLEQFLAHKEDHKKKQSDGWD